MRLMIIKHACIYLSDGCCLLQVSNNPFMLIFGACQIILSQIRNLDELWVMSIIAALVSFGYSSIGLGLAIGKTSGTPTTST